MMFCAKIVSAHPELKSVRPNRGVRFGTILIAALWAGVTMELGASHLILANDRVQGHESSHLASSNLDRTWPRPSDMVPFAMLRSAYGWQLLEGALVLALLALGFATKRRHLAHSTKLGRDQRAWHRNVEARLATAFVTMPDADGKSERAAEQTDEDASRLRKLIRAVEQSPAAVVITGPQGGIEYVNPGFVHATGYEADEVIGKTFRFLKSGIHSPEFYKLMWEQILSKEVWRGEICNRKKNGELIWEDTTLAPVLDAQGTATNYVAVKLDITARKLAEAKLKEALDQLEKTTAFQQAILNSADYSIIATEVDGTITAFNAGAERMLGYRADEMVGKCTPEVFHDRDELIEQARLSSEELGFPLQPSFEAFVAKARLGHSAECEWTYIRKDGTRLPVLLSVTSICDQSGEVTGFLGVAQDITERKRTEEALKVARVQAEEASLAKSQFLASMSHELRTPLNGVIGMTDLLRETELDERQQRYVDACRSSGKALLSLINDLLDFSKIEAGKLELDEQAFDLDQFLAEIGETMAFQARQKGLRLSTHTTPACLCVRGDSMRLRQIMANLIGNAIKFTEKGEVTVRIEGSSEQSGRVPLRFEVADTGAGIPQDRLDRLFKSFSQADSSTTRKYGGTGLGLAISKNLVELMGGRIGVDSRLGQGSTFWFELMLPLGRIAPQRKGDRPGSAEDRRKPGHGGLKARRILLAEDNHVNRLFAEEILRLAGMECRAVENGIQVLQAIESEHFDLVLMDCQMPEMDGFEATRKIREMERSGRITGHIPVIALTANAIVGDPERCAAAGMDDYISKPFDPDKLRETIGRLLKTRAEDRTEDHGGEPERAMQTDRPPPIDGVALLARCQGRLEFAQILLAAFEVELPKVVDQIARDLHEGDTAAAAASAHGLKGSAGTVFAEPLRSVAAAIETAARTGDLSALTSLTSQLESETQLCLRFLPQLREQMTP